MLEQTLRQSNIVEMHKISFLSIYLFFFLIVFPLFKKKKLIYLDCRASIYKRERSSTVIIDNNRHSYCPWNNFQQP